MKKTRIVLVGALVLALALVMGCGDKSKLDESVDGHKQGADKFTHSWTGTYPDGKTYIRSALQFGENGTGKDDELTNIDVNIKMIYPHNGKVGLIWGLTRNEITDANNNKSYTYNYYVFGVGEKPNNESGTLNYYIDYCTNMKTLSGGNTATNSIDTTGGAKSTEIFNEDLTGVPHPTKEALDFDVNIKFTDTDEKDLCDGTYTLTVKVGEDTILTKEINHREQGYVNDVATYHALGTVASYGMISGAVSGEKKVNNTWTINKETLEGAGLNGSKLSAE